MAGNPSGPPDRPPGELKIKSFNHDWTGLLHAATELANKGIHWGFALVSYVDKDEHNHD